MVALLIGFARCSTDQQDLTAQRDAQVGLLPRVELDCPSVEPLVYFFRTGQAPIVCTCRRRRFFLRRLTSEEFARCAADQRILRSVGHTGICYDNAWAESFNGTLKVERVNRTSYPTSEHARIDITSYIELRYNQRRLHSSLGYITPNEAEQNWFDQQPAA